MAEIVPKGTARSQNRALGQDLPFRGRKEGAAHEWGEGGVGVTTGSDASQWPRNVPKMVYRGNQP